MDRFEAVKIVSRENLGVSSGERKHTDCRRDTIPCLDAPRAGSISSVGLAELLA
jgi:hypothetical protein